MCVNADVLTSIRSADGAVIAVVQTGSSGWRLEVGGETELHAAAPLGFCRWRCIVSQI